MCLGEHIAVAVIFSSCELGGDLDNLQVASEKQVDPFLFVPVCKRNVYIEVI